MTASPAALYCGAYSGAGSRRATAVFGRPRGLRASAIWEEPVSVTVVLSTPSFSTIAYSVAALAFDSRTQPWEAGVPRRPSKSVPWIAWPILVKKIEFGIGASSNSLEKWSCSIRKVRKLPFGVSYDGMPVDTGNW